MLKKNPIIFLLFSSDFSYCVGHNSRMAPSAGKSPPGTQKGQIGITDMSMTVWSNINGKVSFFLVYKFFLFNYISQLGTSH